MPTKDGIKTTLPNRVAELYLDMVGEWQLAPLRAICTAPILSGDGSIRDGSGYDQSTGLYLHDVPKLNVPSTPTMEDAKMALLLLRQAFATLAFSDSEMVKGGENSTVPFVDHSKPMGRDEAAFLGRLVTALCRQSLPLAPGLLLNAPAYSGAGTGKGLGVRAISSIAYGCMPYAFTRGDGHQETDKRFVSAVIEGRPMVFLDNANATTLKSETLASFLTERICAVRPLGRSKMIELEIASFFAVTGNGLTITEDLVLRFLHSKFDARMENPELRKFAPGFLEQIEQRRIELLTAALTIWRWGRHNSADLKRGKALGSFELWGRWVRDPLLTLGCPDPVDRLREIKLHDPNRQRAGNIFTGWWEQHESSPVTVNELRDSS